MPHTVRPSYDPIGKAWFFDAEEIADQLLPPDVAAIEAPSIREFITKLPKRYVVATFKSCDPLYVAPSAKRLKKRPFNAGGFRSLASGERRPPTPVPEDPPPPASAPESKTQETKKAYPVSANGRRPSWTPEQYERTLDMWARGISGKVIAEILGIPRIVVSSRIIESARARGDKRAVSRTGVGGRIPVEQHKRGRSEGSRLRANERRKQDRQRRKVEAAQREADAASRKAIGQTQTTASQLSGSAEGLAGNCQSASH